ncbi:MAG: phospho-N-acetylmuramoyl-pentapeptide-transferase [Microbacteriaceae bacterium]|nr:phospho-N-acetylmuramoyl-pentapeptide-transferase [Microbacteriaceae bacterium]
MNNVIWGSAVSFAAAFALIFATLRMGKRSTSRAQPNRSLIERVANVVLSSGGVLLFLAVLLGYVAVLLASGKTIAPSGLLFMALLAGLTLIGFGVDLLDGRKKGSPRTRRLVKFGGQCVVGLAFAIGALNFPNARGWTPASGHISFLGNLRFDFLSLGAIGLLAASIWISSIVVGGGYAVSIVKSYDGLAAGAVSTALVAYLFVTGWQYAQSCLNLNLTPLGLSRCYPTRDPEILTEMTVILLAALTAFIWWNTHPAQIRLGESGALLLGGSLAALAVMTHTELLLVGLGGAFAVFARVALPPRSARIRSGQMPLPAADSTRRVMRIVGGSEVTIVVRFWIVAGLLAGAAIAIFYSAWAYR